MATATNAQKIAGLYAAFFDRAPDAAGLSYWETQFTGTATVNTIASLFAAHPVFETTYGAMTDVEFVNAIYLNVLGAAGDANGVDYWVGQLKNGGADARANFVAKFVNDALTVDLSTFTNLTAAELAVAQGRQDTLTNKVNVGLYFAEKFGAASNITTTGDITKDPAYLAAQAAIKNVTADPASIAAAQGRIDVAVGTSDPTGSLVGQNSELTAALVALTTAQEAEAAFLEANDFVDAAAVTNAVSAAQGILDVETGLTNVSLAVANGVLSDRNTAVTNAQKGVTDAQTAAAAVEGATAAIAARDATKAASVTADAAALVAKAAAAGAETNFNTLNGLTGLDVVGYTEGVVVSKASGTVVVEIEEMTAISYDATGKLVVADSFKEYAGINDLLKAVQADQTAATSAAAADSTASSALTAVTSAPAIKAVDDALTIAKGTLDTAKTQVAELTTAIADLKAAQALEAQHTGLATTVETAHDAVEALGVVINDTGIATADADLFLVNGDAFISGFATAGNDQLFVGTNYVAGTGDFSLHEGNANALEVFFVQNGADTQVIIENKAFASNATSPTDITTITLTGVNVADVHFENGFVSHVA